MEMPVCRDVPRVPMGMLVMGVALVVRPHVVNPFVVLFHATAFSFRACSFWRFMMPQW